MPAKHVYEKKLQSIPVSTKCYFIKNGYFFQDHHVFYLKWGMQFTHLRSELDANLFASARFCAIEKHFRVKR